MIDRIVETAELNLWENAVIKVFICFSADFCILFVSNFMSNFALNL